MTRPRLHWMDTAKPNWWVAEFPTQYTPEQYGEELDAAAVLLAGLPAEQRIVYLADFTATQSSDVRNRAKTAQWLQQHAQPVRKHIVAWGIVVSGAVLQGAVTAVKWLQGFPVPTSVFRDRRECEDWLSQQLVLDEMARENRRKVGLTG
jgi:hypothetical protein